MPVDSVANTRKQKYATQNQRGMLLKCSFFMILFIKFHFIPSQSPVKWVPGALSLQVKRPVREADHSHPCSAQVKNAWSYTSTVPIRLYGMVLS